MEYKTIEGVVLVKVAGLPMLVATRRTEGKCPPFKLLPQGADLWWIMLEKNAEEIKAIQLLSVLSKRQPEEVKEYLHKFIKDMLKWGYLTKVENQNSAS
ncbi:MAG: hypothetical protein IJ212_02690 [Bacteroidaceae bacterium]|nr:hypothetical protein [Bacteroidaceae bacterium]